MLSLKTPLKWAIHEIDTFTDLSIKISLTNCYTFF